MKIEDIERRLSVLRVQRSRIDYAIETLELQLQVESNAKKRKFESNEAQNALIGGSYVLQKVKCGKPTCHCAKPGGELHGPYWHLYTKKDGKTTCKYIGKNKPK
ncbi:MAG: hypothetical protein MUO26_12220 [Methanotrichaceae archaeon]|nr:hypothetical protein [Methanotrichaceae archaeon]